MSLLKDINEAKPHHEKDLDFQKRRLKELMKKDKTPELTAMIASVKEKIAKLEKQVVIDETSVDLKPVKKGLLKELVNTSQVALKRSDGSDAGSTDVADKGKTDVSFNMMRNIINADGTITGSDVANYIERAEELNDEVDTVPFGLETDDGQIVKVYVNAEQADAFEEKMKTMLGMEDDIEEAINRLTTEFDIVDVVWPEVEGDGDGEGKDPDANLEIDDTSNLEIDDDFSDDNYDVVGSSDNGGDGAKDSKEREAEDELMSSSDDEDEDSDADKDEKADKKGDDEESEDDEASDEGSSDDDEEDEDSDDDDPDKPKKKKKKKKAQPAEPIDDVDGDDVKKESKEIPITRKSSPEADSPSQAAAIRLMTEKGLHIKTMIEEPGNIVYMEDDQGTEYVLRGDKKLTKEKHGKLTSLRKEEKEISMTYGSNFLKRILGEAAGGEDRDSVKDGFNIPLDSQSRALAAKLKLPLAKRLIAFMFMAGVPGRYLNTEDSEGTIAAAADMLRKKVAVRRAFLALYDGVANAKGYAIPQDDKGVKEGLELDEAVSDKKRLAAQNPEKIMKAKDAVKKAKKALADHNKTYDGGTGARAKALQAEIDKAMGKLNKLTEEVELTEAARKRGGFIQKLFETVLVQLGLPEAMVTSTGPSAVGTGIYRTAELIEQDATLERALRLLATRLGIKSTDVQEVDESYEGAFDEILNEDVDVGNDDYAQAVVALVSALGIPDDVLQRRRTQIVQALRKTKGTLRNRAQVLTMMSRLSQLLSKNTAPTGGQPDANANQSTNEAASRWKNLTGLK